MIQRDIHLRAFVQSDLGSLMSKRWSRFTGIILAVVLSAISVTFSTPVAANATPFSGTRTQGFGLVEISRFLGKYQVSTDGMGANNGVGVLDIVKPAGATTVVAAYLTAGGKDRQGLEAPMPSVSLDSADVVFTRENYKPGSATPFRGEWTNYFADVTSIVTSFLGGSPAPAGTAATLPLAGTKYSIPAVYVIGDTSEPAGLALTVIFNNPTMNHDASVVTYFGSSDSAGQDFPLTFQTLTSAQVGSSLSFGIAWSSGGGQYSNIKGRNNLSATGTWDYLSGSAGGSDDGASLITVGGVEDATTNPTNPAPGDGQADDELYNLDNFLAAGVNKVTLNMTNPSGDDNIFQAVVSVPFIIAQTASFDSQSGSAVPDVTFTNSFALPSAPTRSGYTFLGWFAASSGGTPLTGTQSASGDVTVFAQWVQNTHNVTFDPHGGSTVAADTYETYINLPAGPTKSGFEFAGWFVASTGGSSLTSPYTPTVAADITLHAQWIPMHRVTFDTQDTNAATGTNYTGTVTLPAAPTRTGYTFNGWFAASSGGSALGATYTPASFVDVTIYAQWTAVPHRVTFDTQDSNAATGTNYTGTVTLPAAPTRTGYTFNGWFAASSGGSALGATYTPTSFADITIYAQWTLAPVTLVSSPSQPEPTVYIVTYDSQGGSSVSPGTYTATFTLAAAPTRTGYSFIGWFISATGGAKLSSPVAPNRKTNITLFAQWSKLEYAVTFEAQGGSAVAPQTFQESIALTAKSSRPGYVFLGWYKTAGGGGILPAEFKPEEIGDVTVYAHWQKNPVLIASGFADGSPLLNKSTKAAILSFAQRNPGFSKVQCIGYTEGPTVLASDLRLSKLRGQNACAMVKHLLGSSIQVIHVDAVQTRVESAQQRRVKILLTK